MANKNNLAFDGNAYQCPCCGAFELRELRICKGKPQSDHDWENPELCVTTGDWECDNCREQFSETRGGELIGDLAE